MIKALYKKISLFFIFRNIINNSPNHFVIFVNHDRRIVYANPAALEKFGSIKGKKAKELYANSKDADKVSVSLKKEGKFIGEVKNLDKQGQEIDCRLTAYIVKDIFGRASGTVGISEDITEQKKVLARLAETELLSAMGEATANVAHAGKNLFQNVTASLEMIFEISEKEGDCISVKKTLIQRALNDLARGSRFFYEVLSYAGQGSYDFVLTNINNVIKRCLESANLSLEVKGQSAYKVSVDLMRIHEAFLNIILNAKETLGSDGKIEISIEDLVCLKDGQETLCVLIKISDNGSGMEEKVLKNIFKPFFTTKKKGNGLGLSYTFGCIKQHGGIIKVESQVNVGTSFHVYLPIK